MSLSINPTKLELVEKEGLKFFKNFSAIDKNGNKVKLSIDNPDSFTSITIKENSGKQVGLYDIEMNKNNSTLEGVQIYVNQNASNANLGQILTLASLLEFKLNKLNLFKIFTLKESLPFHLKYGFVIDNNNPDFVADGLKYLKKSRVSSLDNLKNQANILLPKLISKDSAVANDKNTLEKGCQIISDYIKYLSRMGLKNEEPQFDYGTHLKLSTWDFEKNKVYLNELLRKHKIDFQF